MYKKLILSLLFGAVLVLAAGCSPALTPAPTQTPVPTLTATVPPTATMTPTAVPPTPTPTTPPDYQVSVWASYAGFLEMNVLRQQAGLIREVNFVWYQLTKAGNIQGSNANPAAVKELQDAGMRVMPAIQNGGFSPQAVHDRISEPEKRKQHVDDLVNIVMKENYDGLDIDYESMHAEDRDAFSAFIEELSAALHANGKLLSVTVHAKTSDEGTWEGPKAQDWKRLGAAADLFKIMTYDYSNGTGGPGPIAPISWVDEVLNFAATQVPAGKTYVGLPFYGYDYGSGSQKDVTWMSTQALITRQSAVILRDENGEAYFTYDSGGPHTVYFNDAQATQTKVKTILAAHPHLAGVAIWVLGGEDPQNWPALRTLFHK